MADNLLRVTTPPRAIRKQEVWLGEDGPYWFTYPKLAPIVIALRDVQEAEEPRASEIAHEAQDGWLGAGFGAQWLAIRRRLNTPTDPLNIDHIFDLFEQLLRVAYSTRKAAA